MTYAKFRFSHSSNGDRWFLTCANGSGKMAVMHEANLPSGGAVTSVSIEDFLRGNPQSPERQDLIRLIANLLGNDLDSRKAPTHVSLIKLRDCTEADALDALRGAKVQLPLTTPYEALEFFNCLIDVVTGQRAVEEGEDLDRIRPGFGSTHH